MEHGLYLLLGGVVAVVVVVGVIYNTFVHKDNVAKNVFATIDVLLKKRCDLVPNLVETVKGYAKHEESVLSRIAELRSQAPSDAAPDDDKIEFDRRLSGGLGRLMAIVESYPELKADKNFLQLQMTLTELEDQISAARRAYNAAMTDFNNSLEMFPTNIFGSMFGFKRKRLFHVDEAGRGLVDVGF